MSKHANSLARSRVWMREATPRQKRMIKRIARRQRRRWDEKRQAPY